MILQFSKFLTIGAINTAVGLAVITAAMYFFGMNPIIANAIGYLTGIVISFILNGKLTFRQKMLSRPMFVRFVVICLVAYMANVVAVSACLGHGKYVAQIVGMAVYTPVSFLGCRLFVFR